MLKPHDPLDELFRETQLTPPQDFSDKLMQRLEWEPLPVVKQPAWWQWLALCSGFLIGIFQVFAFLLSVWAFNTAG